MSNEKKKARNIRSVVVLVIFLALIAVGVKIFVLDANKIYAHFENPDGEKTSSFALAMANDSAARTKGLMFVKSMGSHDGMIFIFPQEEVQSFWMKNTYIPLDMIFVDANRKVIGVLSDVPILNEKPRSVGRPAKMVIELNSGQAKKEGIVEGSILMPRSELPEGR